MTIFNLRIPGIIKFKNKFHRMDLLCREIFHFFVFDQKLANKLGLTLPPWPNII